MSKDHTNKKGVNKKVLFWLITLYSIRIFCKMLVSLLLAWMRTLHLIRLYQQNIGIIRYSEQAKEWMRFQSVTYFGW